MTGVKCREEGMRRLGAGVRVGQRWRGKKTGVMYEVINQSPGLATVRSTAGGVGVFSWESLLDATRFELVVDEDG